MKSFFIFLFLVSIYSFSFGQHVIVETGRPAPPLLVNAKEIAGKKFKVVYKYVPFNNTTEQIDSITAVNHETSLFLEKKLGKNWETELNDEIDFEFRKLVTLINKLKTQGDIKDNNSIYFYKKGCFKKKYVAEIYPDIPPEERNKETLIKKVVF